MQRCGVMVSRWQVMGRPNAVPALSKQPALCHLFYQKEDGEWMECDDISHGVSQELIPASHVIGKLEDKLSPCCHADTVLFWHLLLTEYQEASWVD